MTSGRLLEQEEEDDTYMAIPVLSYLIKNMDEYGRGEHGIHGVWRNILQAEFTIRDGYSSVPVSNTRRVRQVYLVTSHIVMNGPGAQEHEFLCVECTALPSERQDGACPGATTQLRDRLSGLDNTLPNGRKFGAAVVGKMVSFCEWDSATQNIIPLDNGAQYHVERQCKSITRWLRFFRDNHQ